MLVTIFGVAAWPEKYDLIAEGDVVVRKAMNQEPSFEDALYVLKPGERIAVSGCVDSKSDVAVRVIAPPGVAGYVGVGDFRLADSIIKCNTQPVRYRDGQTLRTTHL